MVETDTISALINEIIIMIVFGIIFCRLSAAAAAYRLISLPAPALCRPHF